MSLEVLTQGGGAGGESASIFVTGLSESDVVTAKKGEETIVAKWNGTESRFEIAKIKEYGTWTVKATNGEKTTTQDVLVDAAVEFEIEMYLNRTYLYKYGDECTAVTGGWDKHIATSSAGHVLKNESLTVTKEQDCIILSFAPTVGNAIACFGTNSIFDITEYEKVCFEISAPNCGAGCFIDVGVKNSNALSTGYLPNGLDVDIHRVMNVGESKITEKTVWTIDISSATNDAFAAVEFANLNNNGSVISFTIYNVWLE